MVCQLPAGKPDMVFEIHRTDGTGASLNGPFVPSKPPSFGFSVSCDQRLSARFHFSSFGAEMCCAVKLSANGLFSQAQPLVVWRLGHCGATFLTRPADR
jgi:hypothetical protein